MIATLIPVTLARPRRRRRRRPAPGDLPAGRPRHRVDDLELERHLVGGQDTGAVSLQRVEVAPRWIHDDLGAGHFADARVGPAEHAGLLDARELVDAVLDFLGEELQARDEDHRLLPAL